MRIMGSWNTHILNTYILQTGPAATPITVAEVKNYLKLDSDDTADDDLISIMIDAVVLYAEGFTGRDLINKTYVTYRRSFEDLNTIRRSKLQSISSIKYYNASDVLTTVSNTIYRVEPKNDYSSVVLTTGNVWPSSSVITTRPNPIEIVFVAGYGASASSVPAPFKLALLQHVAMLYENRGDCSDGGCDCGSMVPVGAKMCYNMFKIKNIIAEDRKEYSSGEYWW